MKFLSLFIVAFLAVGINADDMMADLMITMQKCSESTGVSLDILAGDPHDETVFMKQCNIGECMMHDMGLVTNGQYNIKRMDEFIGNLQVLAKNNPGMDEMIEHAQSMRNCMLDGPDHNEEFPFATPVFRCMLREEDSKF